MGKRRGAAQAGTQGHECMGVARFTIPWVKEASVQARVEVSRRTCAQELEMQVRSSPKRWGLCGTLAREWACKRVREGVHTHWGRGFSRPPNTRDIVGHMRQGVNHASTNGHVRVDPNHGEWVMHSPPPEPWACSGSSGWWAYWLGLKGHTSDQGPWWSIMGRSKVMMSCAWVAFCLNSNKGSCGVASKVRRV